AQPPLYKVKKGRHEQYLKDEDAMLEYQTSMALEGASLHVNESAPAITGEHLEKLVKDFRKVEVLIQRLSRRAPEIVLNELIYQPELSVDALSDENAVQDWITA